MIQKNWGTLRLAIIHRAFSCSWNILTSAAAAGAHISDHCIKSKEIVSELTYSIHSKERNLFYFTSASSPPAPALAVPFVLWASSAAYIGKFNILNPQQNMNHYEIGNHLLDAISTIYHQECPWKCLKCLIDSLVSKQNKTPHLSND